MQIDFIIVNCDGCAQQAQCFIPEKETRRKLQGKYMSMIRKHLPNRGKASTFQKIGTYFPPNEKCGYSFFGYSQGQVKRESFTITTDTWYDDMIVVSHTSLDDLRYSDLQNMTLETWNVISHVIFPKKENCSMSTSEISHKVPTKKSKKKKEF